METSIAGLETKRVTLEEKMIKNYLHTLVIAIAEYVSQANTVIKSGAFDIEKDVVKDLVSLHADMQPVFEDLQNKIDYDWNFFLSNITNMHSMEGCQTIICLKNVSKRFPCVL